MVTFSWRRLLFNPTNWVLRRDEPLRGRKKKRHSVSPEKVSLRPAARDGKGLNVHTLRGDGEGQARVKSQGKGSALTLPGRRDVPVVAPCWLVKVADLAVSHQIHQTLTGHLR